MTLVTVTVDDQTKTYGQPNPELTFKVDGTLVGDDKEDALGVTLSCNADADTPVGTAVITGTVNSDNYAVNVISGTLTITKAAAPTPKFGNLDVANGKAHTYTFGLGALLPVLSDGQNFGTVTCELGNVNLGSYYDSASVSGQTLTLSIQEVDSESEGQIGTVTITIHTGNFEDMTATINVCSVNKAIPMGEPILSSNTLTYGQTLSAITLSGSMTDGENDVPGTFAWSNPENRPAAQEAYQAAWVFTPADNDAYVIVNGTVNLTVNKADPAVTAPTGLTATPGQLLSSVALPGGWTWENPETIVGTTGAFPAVYTPSDTANYNVLRQNLTVTVEMPDIPVYPVYEKVATPTASPSGGSFSGSLTVTLSCTTPGAEIYYTTDGTTPYPYTMAMPSYTSPVTLTSTTTIKAIAVKAGMTPSDVLSVTYTYTLNEDPGYTTPYFPSIPNTTFTPSTPDTPSVPSTPSTPSTPGSLPVTTGTTSQGSVSSTQTTASPTAFTSSGTATAIVDAAMGDEIVRQAVSNNSKNIVIAPSVTESVTKAEVSIPASTVGQIMSQTNASLTVSTPVANVTIPNGGLSSLSSMGGTVTVTTEQTGRTVALSVVADGSPVTNIPGGVTLTVPTVSATSGTVAVLVHEDGTREVVRKSVASNGSVTIPLNGSATLEIVDNSKRFDDVPATSWEADAVSFASAHELFNGTSSTQFSPDQPMSRGMLAVVLHNLESNPSQAFTGMFADVSSHEWYAEGIAWAASRGVVDGYGDGQFGPNDNITREQLAVMLWRYAGSPAAASSQLYFTDTNQVSDWARDALCWTTENGIINGKGGGILDPTGQATRAETAQMLKNFLENQ